MRQCVTDCIDCVNNYTQCQQCISGKLVLLNNCVAGTTIQNGKGKDDPTTPKKLIDCQDNKCTKCAADFSSCTECNSVSGYKLKTASVTKYDCIPQASYSEGKGRNPSTTAYEDCATLDCSACIVSNVCTACKLNYVKIKLTQDATQFNCVLIPLIPIGWGINPSDVSEAVTCVVDKCENCRSDSSRCQLCAAGFYYDNVNNLCKSTDTIADLSGYDTVTRNVKLCSNINCQDCKNNYL